jgi:hypothetical protein
MSNAILIGTIAAAAIVLSVLIALINKPKTEIRKIRIGNVELTANALEYVIGRMRERILTLTDENEKLQQELWKANCRLYQVSQPVVTWEAYKNEKAS